jgi:predicted Zn-dependent protease
LNILAKLRFAVRLRTGNGPFDFGKWTARRILSMSPAPAPQLLTGIGQDAMLKFSVIGPARALCWTLVSVAFCAMVSIARAEPPAPADTNRVSQLFEFAGTVEITVAYTNDWRPARLKQFLHPGDRLRTAADSRATLQLSDRSVIRVSESTILEIQPPTQPARHRFGLKRGALFFLDRERPADVEFETPLATGAIRGTEFLLAVAEADAATRLALLDGAVNLQTAAGQLQLTSGQQALVNPGQPPQLVAALPAVNLIQWCFYYPAVLNPDEIAFAAAEKSALAKSLSAYTGGDLLQALAEAPDALVAQSDATRIYFAALKLAVGQVAEAETLIAPVGESANPLRELIAAVKFQAIPLPREPANSSGWLARSYYLQSRSQLPTALNAARQSAKLAPDFGFAWARVAELEFDSEHRREARDALDRARSLSPRNAQAVALEGFMALAENHPLPALDWFERALALDGSLPSAWLGRALAEAQVGDDEEARRDLQIAATLEPQRGLFRSYLGKAWSQSGQDKLAERDFALAEKLDQADPTAWLYSALHRFQTHQVNDAIRDLEHSAELNDNRSIFRSRLQLDRDRATRSADLAAIYDAAGMTEVSERAASRAVEESYSDFAGHLFLADSLGNQEDPQRFDLRLETARESELLVANLLAPPGGGNLSQILSEQDRLQYFDTRPFGFSSLTEYDSRGDWNQAASAFGSADGFSYAFDGQYISQSGWRPDNDQFDRQLSLTAKQQIAPGDSAYFQAAYFHGEYGDLAQYYDPATANFGLRVDEEQNPNLFIGWNHEWSPGSHTLLLFSRLTDRLSLTNPSPSVLFAQQDGAGFIGAEAYPSTLNQDLNFTLYSAEAQQILESLRFALIFGGRYQRGTADTHSTLTAQLFGAMTDQSVSSYLERLNGYGYFQWRPVTAIRLTAGLSYDRLTYPQNVDSPPVAGGEEERSLLGPKAGFIVEPWRGGWLHGAWSRSLGGLFFDNSVRLEPAEVAGFTSAFRSLIPESVEGLVPGTKFDSWTLGFDQSLPSQTYFGVGAEWLQSDGARDLGALTNTVAFIPATISPTTFRQTLDYRERNLSAYVNQLICRDWSAGARYRLSEGKLNAQLPGLAGVPGATTVQQEQNERAVLQHGQLFLIYNHPCGFFAGWSSDWYHQDNHGDAAGLADADFWQHNFFAGYVFPHRRAELRLGILNLTGQDYRLNPLNLQPEPARGRTFTAALRLNF